ncbi:D-2-hydroxyacid dehydrogenase family protein [Pararhizobium haloflavum]|uniref:D-2-hydroxyacid dehydrogenase family protein n=1 Tax=Pararhizobium haloflavum TaxID=2037914 RepID=UPI000C182775|nr:D-2-hydroxyacid dehydrogenase family protein [Pararhizobium haloflavum]
MADSNVPDRLNIAVLDDYAGVSQQLADWSGLGDITVFNDTIKDEARLIEWLRPFDVICVMRERTPMPASVLKALPNLKLLVSTGVRNLSIDLAAAAEMGVIVCGTELRGNATSELAMALILAANRRVIAEADSLRAGGWQKGLGRDLAGQTLGLVGLGKIGAQMAAHARGFGMSVVAWSQNLTQERCDAIGVERCADLPTLMRVSDTVSIHLVLSDRTRGLIDRDALAAAKDGAVLVNTSRGPIIDQTALLDGLRAGRPALAALDVFDEEPLPKGHPILDPALIESGRLILTPHLGYTTEQTFSLFYRQTVEAIRAWRDGAPIRQMGL